MAAILPRDLPALPGAQNPSAAVIIDNLDGVYKQTPAAFADALRPYASQAEAAAGAENTKVTTSLRVKQAIDAQAVTQSAAAASGGSALFGFLQAGTGATSRTGQAKLRDGVTVNDFGAVGGGGNDTTPLASAATAAVGREFELPLGMYRTTAPVAIGADSTVSGKGRGTGISTTTVDHHLLLLQDDGSVVRDMSIEGVAGTTVLNNSAVRFNGTVNSAAFNVEASGMSGMGFYLSVTDKITVAFCHVHDLPSTGFVNGADIGSFTSNTLGNFLFNRLEGGTAVECGVLLQLDSTSNRVVGNDIAAHASYGIIDYDITPRATGTIIAMNRIKDIDGAGFGGQKGAGIYCSLTGGQVVGFNHITNTNIGTVSDGLAPGGVGFNNMFEPSTIVANVVKDANWYGLTVAATTVLSAIDGNIVTEADRGGVFINSSSFAHVSGNVITQLTATPLTVRGISVNVLGGGPFKHVSVLGNRVRGSLRSIEVGFTDYSNVSDNNVSETNGIGIKLADGTGLTCQGNVVFPTAASPALDVSACTYTTITGNVFKGTANPLISFSGTCTGSFFDKSNVLCGATMDNISNAASGMVVEVYGTAPPTLLTHQVGDRVINRAPAVGQPKAWVCTVAGVPGTWVSEGNL